VGMSGEVADMFAVECFVVESKGKVV
jgi:hypothetical protein